MSSNDYIVVLTTCPSEDEGKTIAKTLVKEKLIACANIVANVLSIYKWESKLCEDNEVLIIIKSQRKHFQKISKRIKDLHSYDVPEIIALPIIKGSKTYLDWILSETNMDL